MKRPLVLTIVSLFIATAAMADHIGIYADATGTSCNLAMGPAPSTGKIIHKFAAGASESRFKLTPSVGIIGFTPDAPFAAIGSVTSDLVVGYGGCLAGSIVAGTITGIWLSPGTLSVVASDGFPSVLAYDCAMVEHPATGGFATIGGAGSPCGEPSAVEASTWGSVKALYR